MTAPFDRSCRYLRTAWVEGITLKDLPTTSEVLRGPSTCSSAAPSRVINLSITQTARENYAFHFVTKGHSIIIFNFFEIKLFANWQLFFRQLQERKGLGTGCLKNDTRRFVAIIIECVDGDVDPAPRFRFRCRFRFRFRGPIHQGISESESQGHGFRSPGDSGRRRNSSSWSPGSLNGWLSSTSGTPGSDFGCCESTSGRAL